MEAPPSNAELVSASVADAVEVIAELPILRPVPDATRALAELQ